MNKYRLFITALVLSLVSLFSCNNDEYALPSGKGRINVLLTDSPFPIDLISNTYVSIDRVEIRQKSEEGLGEDADSFIVVAEGEMEIDLLQLTNGITEQIATADLEAGVYDMIRLHVTDATIVLADGSEFDLKIPSGSSSGLKIKIDPAISLSEGETSDVLLDFDVSRSFVVKGNINGNIEGFNFKPVVRGVYMGSAGRIEGTVSDTTSNPLENAMIKLFMPEDGILDSLIMSSFTDVEGSYKLIGVPEGVYSIVCELEGFASDTVNDVSVSSGNATTVNFQLE
ncbi:MAG: DUF4382 domain-containing protein [Prolixibacteraceae bacterium]|nr:DUF4382 domain-containing protein [Prolixibacteraceae bacterium]MDD4755182.1 DUF4382 domain-containing protein [Prolixibacteraceae bacterium]NLO02847.1 DUF4382 domain-containing protein [Bacteroidales bacterium]